MNLDTIPVQVRDLVSRTQTQRTSTQRTLELPKPRTFVISDTHFFHKKISVYEPIRKQFECCEQTMIVNWQRVVQEHDIVYHLGDVAFGLKSNYVKLKSLLASLPGYKILIKGNHDQYKVDYIELGFDEVKDYEIIDGVFLNHYPLVESEYDNEALQQLKKERLELCVKEQITSVLHGHVHSNKVPVQNVSIPHFNCSVENINFTPILLQTAERMSLINLKQDFKF